MKVLERDREGHSNRCTGGKVILKKHFEPAGTISVNPGPEVNPPMVRKTKAWF